jgi:hypothetical protein
MRYLILAVLIILVPQSRANGKTFSLYRPPFYTMTYEEISEINSVIGKDRAATLYASSLLKELKNLAPSSSHPMTPIQSLQELTRLTYSDEQWNKLRADVFYACEERPENGGCPALLKIRMDYMLGTSPLHHTPK